MDAPWSHAIREDDGKKRLRCTSCQALVGAKPRKSCALPQHGESYKRIRARYTPAKGRRKNLRDLYDVTVDEYNELYSEQHGVCAICGESETALLKGRPKMLAVDHDHDNPRILPVLCSRCNPMLGFARYEESTLLKAAEYLRKSE